MNEKIAPPAKERTVYVRGAFVYATAMFGCQYHYIPFIG